MHSVKIKKELDYYFPEVNINDPRDLIRPFEFLIRVLSDENGLVNIRFTRPFDFDSRGEIIMNSGY